AFISPELREREPTWHFHSVLVLRGKGYSAQNSDRYHTDHCDGEWSSLRGSLLLLRARGERPHRRATQPCDELAPYHSITSSARARRFFRSGDGLNTVTLRGAIG